MCSSFRKFALLIAAALLVGSCAKPENQKRVLRVCSDPNNLPFSNEREEGFENRIADLVARDLGARLEYSWFAQRRGFVRNTLNAGTCDLIMGVPSNYELVATTRPYYRSTYVFVTRKDRNLNIASLDDPALRRLQIGVHVIGDDYANPPPLHALGRRKITTNVSGYSIFGDYSKPNPPARLVEAVAHSEVDVAVVWGPFAGYFGKKQSTPLRITPVLPEIDPPSLPFAFDIAMGVRRGEDDFRKELEHVLDRQEASINEILDQYGVPRKPLVRAAAAATKR